MEKEYIKLFRLVMKYEHRIKANQPVKMLRIVKKVEALVNRALFIEEAIRIPSKYQWTKGYK